LTDKNKKLKKHNFLINKPVSNPLKGRMLF
jgi:hypothetical protein